MSIISAGTTTTTAFKVTGDTTGSLVLKTGASGLTAVDIDASQVVTIGNIAVTGGTINNTVIGGTTAAAGTFTTLSAASTVTFNGGTANGVAYLNGSKNLTTGSALVFDGANLGVGTASPVYRVDALLGAGSGNIVRFGQSGVSNGYTITTNGTALTHDWSNGGGVAMSLNTSGNLGVGTSSPAYRLDVERSGDGITAGIAGGTYGIRFDNGGTFSSGMSTIHGVDSTLVGSYQPIMLNGSDVRFGTSATERARIASTGFRFGLGTTDPTSNGGSDATVMHLHNPSVGQWSLNHYTTGSTGSAGGDGTIAGLIGSDYYIFNYESSNLIFATSSAERARITSAGNFGIGTTSPSFKFHVKGVGSYDGNIFADNSSTTGGGIFGIGVNGTRVAFISTSGSAVGDTSQDIAIFNETNNGIRLYTNSVERVRITSAGLVGIGTSSPATRLDVAGKIRLTPNTADLNYLAEVYANYDSAHPFQIDVKNNGTTFETLGVYANGGGGNERLTVPSMPLVVGGTTVYGKVSVYANSNGVNDVWIRNDSAGSSSQCGLVLNASGNSWRMGMGSTANNSNALTWVLDVSAPSEKMRLTTGGNLLIGTTSATFASANGGIQVGGSGGGGTINISGGYTADAALNVRDFANNLVSFFFSSTKVGSITTNGSTTAYNTSSDRRLKDNIVPAPSASSVIDAIQVVSHDWKAGGHTRYGMIAQDLHEVAPEAVKVGDSGEEVKDIWGVDYSKLVPILVKELQSVRARLAALEAK